MITGGEKVKGRGMREDYTEFPVTFKLLVATNHPPVVRGTEVAMWERINLFPWDVYIPPEERDKDLQEKLKKEWPGILAWAVRGCLDWKNGGLKHPEKVRAATEKYRVERDTLGRFVTEYCSEDKEGKSPLSLVLEKYITWGGHRGTTDRVLADALRKKGFKVGKGTKNLTYVFGLLLPDKDYL
jgi:putative DNA primase/helicase